MNVKGGNFFEKHIEKLILAAVGLVCLWLLVTRVLVSPNKVSFANRQFSVGEIDPYIREQAQRIRQQLDRPPQPKEPYQTKVDSFVALLEGAPRNIKGPFPASFPLVAKLCPEAAKYAILNIDPSVAVLLPYSRGGEVVDRKYHLPRLAAVDEVSVEHIRAVAYVPVADVDLDNPYQESKSEPNDIDFVTVAAKFDVQQLVHDFQRCFAGDTIPPQWRDPCLAKPVFAAVQLQRQQSLPDGRWSNWQDVPRTKVDARKDMFQIIEDVDKLPPGGIKVRMLKFNNPDVMINLLQPEPYRIASAEEEWFPPSLHRQYCEYQKKLEAWEKQKAREEQKRTKQLAGKENFKEGRAGRYADRRSPYGNVGRRPFPARGMDRFAPDYRTTARGPYPPQGRGRREEEVYQQRYGFGRSSTSSARSKKPDESVLNDIYDEFDDILLTNKTDITKMDKPLMFWAHDDTVEPGRTYRYRIRLGVFNPVAGTEQIAEEDQDLKNKAILWTPWSKETEPIEIPARLYFFPQQVQEAAKRVTVEIFKYTLGYWYSQIFPVDQGEVIGKAVEYEPEAEQTDQLTMKDVTLPEIIDYSTGAVMVDVDSVNIWSETGRRLGQKRYQEMIYTMDGNGLEHLPIGFQNWPRYLQSKFREVQAAEDKPRKPWKSFAKGWGRGRRGLRRPKGKAPEGQPEIEDERYLEEMEQLQKMLGY